jgi:glycosyltransferase involved in cell wall biosynthesis
MALPPDGERRAGTVANAVSDRRPLVTVVVPVFNEAAIFEPCMAELVAHLRTLEDRWRFEVLIVDDGSTDATSELADAFAAGHDDVRVLRHVTNFRLGSALRFGFGQSRGDYVVTFDSDLSYSPDHIERMLETIQATRAKIVIASPYMEGGRTTAVPAFRRLLSSWANKFLSLTAQQNLTSQQRLTTLTGLVRAYDGLFIRTLDLKAVDADVNTEVIYKAQILRARIEEVPAHLDWSAIVAHRGKGRIDGRLVWTTLKQLVSGFLFRPFMFFIVPGLAMLTVSAVSATWAAVVVSQEYGDLPMDERSTSAAVAAGFDRSPEAFLVAVVTVLLAVLLLALGVLALQAKRYFEELFHLGSAVLRATTGGRPSPPPAD